MVCLNGLTYKKPGVSRLINKSEEISAIFEWIIYLEKYCKTQKEMLDIFSNDNPLFLHIRSKYLAKKNFWTEDQNKQIKLILEIIIEKIDKYFIELRKQIIIVQNMLFWTKENISTDEIGNPLTDPRRLKILFDQVEADRKFIEFIIEPEIGKIIGNLNKFSYEIQEKFNKIENNCEF